MYCVKLKNENSWLKKFLTIGEKTVTTKWKLDWLTSALKPTDDRLTFTHTMSALKISRCITRRFCKCKIWVLLDTRQFEWVVRKSFIKSNVKEGFFEVTTFKLRLK